MSYGELTIQNINAWADSADQAETIVNKWRAAVFKTDRPGKKEDLKNLQILLAEIEAAQKAINSLAWETQRMEAARKSDQEKIRKLQRYCRALGGDPGLIYWHRDSDFV
jgi:hypothetical protein